MSTHAKRKKKSSSPRTKFLCFDVAAKKKKQKKQMIEKTFYKRETKLIGRRGTLSPFILTFSFVRIQRYGK